MKLSGLRKLVLAGLALVGCDSFGVTGPPRDLEHAAITNSCGPADGPAVEIFLVPESMESLPPQTPYVRVYLARSVQELDGQRWELGPNSEGGAWYFATANEFEIATWGVVTVDSVSDDLTVEGDVNLVFPSGRHVWGEFRAKWFSSNRLCG